MTENNKKFYIVARVSKTTGIGAILKYSLMHSIYAIDNNYIPIVDLKHYNNQYFKEGRTFKDNIWEYFFEQPAGYKLEDIDENSDVIISDKYLPKEIDKLYRLEDYGIVNENLVKSNTTPYKLRGRYKTIFKFNQETNKYVESVYNRVINENKNVLGVLCRGTDYTTRKSIGEPVQPSVKQVILKVYEYLKKYPEIEKIYLATEDETIYQRFKKEFGDKLLDNGQYRYNYTKKDKTKYLSEIVVDRPNHNYELAREYLSSLYILSKCKYFIGGMCGGTQVAWFMQDNWKDIYVWNLGKYGDVNTWKDKVFSIYTDNRKNRGCTVVRFLGFKFFLSKKFKEKFRKNKC